MTDLIGIMTTFVTFNFTLLMVLFSIGIVHHLIRGISSQAIVIGNILIIISWFFSNQQLLVIGILILAGGFTLKMLGVK